MLSRRSVPSLLLPRPKILLVAAVSDIPLFFPTDDRTRVPPAALEAGQAIRAGFLSRRRRQHQEQPEGKGHNRTARDNSKLHQW